MKPIPSNKPNPCAKCGTLPKLTHDYSKDPKGIRICCPVRQCPMHAVVVMAWSSVEEAIGIWNGQNPQAEVKQPNSNDTCAQAEKPKGGPSAVSGGTFGLTGKGASSEQGQTTGPVSEALAKFRAEGVERMAQLEKDKRLYEAIQTIQSHGKPETIPQTPAPITADRLYALKAAAEVVSQELSEIIKAHHHLKQ